MARYQPGVETRARIVSAIRDLLGEVGLEGTTLKSICDRAGIRAGSFYNLFDSKDEAVLEVVRDAIQAVDPDPGRHGDERLEDLVAAYVRFVTNDPVVARIYLQMVIGGALTDLAMRDRALRHHRSRVARFTAAAQRDEEGLEPGPAQDRAEAMLAALNGLAFRWLLDPEFDLRGHAARLCRPAVGRESRPQDAARPS